MALAATRPRPFDYLMCASTDRLARNLDTAGRIIGNLTFNLFGFDSPPLAASA
jgi:DNA invertase Pin-like site-specific DNA recombinase